MHHETNVVLYQALCQYFESTFKTQSGVLVFADTKDACFLPGLASALAAEGQSSLRFDFSGNGESGGEFVYAGYWREVS